MVVKQLPIVIGGVGLLAALRFDPGRGRQRPGLFDK
jgi:hypothetical protein